MMRRFGQPNGWRTRDSDHWKLSSPSLCPGQWLFDGVTRDDTQEVDTAVTTVRSLGAEDRISHTSPERPGNASAALSKVCAVVRMAHCVATIASWSMEFSYKQVCQQISVYRVHVISAYIFLTHIKVTGFCLSSSWLEQSLKIPEQQENSPLHHVPLLNFATSLNKFIARFNVLNVKTPPPQLPAK